MTSIASDPELDALRAVIASDLPAYLADLEAPRQHRLRELHAGRRRPVGAWTGRFLEALGATVEHRPDPDGRYGKTVVATFDGRVGAPRVLLIGHMDTVFDPGTAAARPFRIEDGVAYGPGVTDMKSGLLAGLYAIKALVGELGGVPFERLTFVANPDEEIGSPTSTPAHPGDRPDRRRLLRPRMRPGQRRHRVGAQGDPGHAHRDRRAGPPTPGSSPRRVAARSSRRAGSCATCTRSTAAGRA